MLLQIRLIIDTPATFFDVPHFYFQLITIMGGFKESSHAFHYGTSAHVMRTTNIV
jgi:hypothetical protein